MRTMSRWIRRFFPAVAIVAAGCTSLTDVEGPALLEFTLEPAQAQSESELAWAERVGPFLKVQGFVGDSGCYYLVPTVHGGPRDVRLELTYRQTGSPCIPIIAHKQFTARIGMVDDTRDVRVRVVVHPAGTMLLDTLVTWGFRGSEAEWR